MGVIVMSDDETIRAVVYDAAGIPNPRRVRRLGIIVFFTT
jgi:hypothetical protein